MRQEYIDLYDAYTHEHLDRRRFMRRLAELAGGTAAAAAIIAAIEANPARAAMIAADDARLTADRVSFEGAGGTMQGYLARPAGASGPAPGVMVIHENRGLNAHIEDVARRVALEGFTALAPDFLSPLGGTPADADVARDMIGKLDPTATVGNAAAVVAYLEGQPNGTGKVGVVGFCWGGALTNQTAVNVPMLGAAVAYYGRQPTAAEAAKIKAPVMLHYAGLDERINAGIADYEAALKAAGVEYTVHMYDGVNHAFNNDTSAERYDKAAAELAWGRTIAFLKEKLAAAA
jgi:carboxymethylenebutenolidase